MSAGLEDFDFHRLVGAVHHLRGYADRGEAMQQQRGGEAAAGIWEVVRPVGLLAHILRDRWLDMIRPPTPIG